MKTWTKLLMMAGAALMLAGVSGCGKPSVSVTNASLSQVPLTIEDTVTPEAAHSAPVIPMVSGAITGDTQIPDVGTKVTAGQVLFQVDSSKYESQAEALRAQIAAATTPQTTTTVVQQAPVDNSMEASLLQQGIITRAEYDKIQGRKGGGTQTVTVPSSGGGQAPQGLVASLQSIEKAISDCTIRAPIDGVISNVYITGDNKQAVAGKPALMIRQDSPVVANIQLPSSVDKVIETAKVKKTLTVSISDGTNVWYGELNHQKSDAKTLDDNGNTAQAAQDNKAAAASASTASATPSDGTFSMYKIQVDNPDGKIAIGKSYKVRIETGQDAACYLIPSSAIIKNNQVAVVTDQNLVDLRNVVVAGTVSGQTMVLAGLKDGDRVINNPPAGIEIGMEVKVK